MKKIIITALALSAIATTAFSQGTVLFATGATASNKVNTNSVVGGAAAGNVIGVNNYYFALFASSSQTSVNGQTAAVSGVSSSYVFDNLGGGTAANGWVLVGIGSSQASAGRFGAITQGTTDGNQAALNSDNSLTVSGIGLGALANFVSIGWSANIGSTLSAVETWYNGGYATQGWIGQSAVGVGLTLGNGGSISPSSSMGTGTGQVPGYLLGVTAVPEPATMALAALGGASLLMLRRKK
jgi:hypothetical protein